MATANSASGRIAQVFERIDQLVWLVTAADRIGDQSGSQPAVVRRGALVASWVMKASINPQTPVVSVGLAPNHFTTELVLASRAFALHLISAAQVEIALELATGSGRDRDKLADVPHRIGSTGSPIISNCLAWLECRVICEFNAGDRIYFLADVVEGFDDVANVPQAKPLTENQFFQLLIESQKALLKQDRDQDIEIQKPMLAQWRASLED